MKIYKSWQLIITDLVERYEKLQPESGVIEFTKHHFRKCNPANIHSYFCPDIYIWDPVLPSIRLHNKPVICLDHICDVEPSNLWMDGSTSSRCPRVCITNSGPTLIVGQDYKCCFGDHKIRSTDNRFLTQCSRFSNEIVFTHKTSCTIGFLGYLVKMVTGGMSFERVRSCMEELVSDKFFLDKEKYISDCILNKTNVDTSLLIDIKETLVSMIPTAKSLKDIFVAWFRELESGINYDMSSIKSRSIFFDHTYKITTGVGAFRVTDAKWVKLFGSLFIAMNENKEVVSWKFVNSEKFSIIEDCLSKIVNKNSIAMIVIDNCCKLANLIQTLLGENIVTKLDPFHGIQRVITTIKKSHPYRKAICAELRNILRQRCDMQGSRKLETDSPEYIENRINRLIEKWKSVDPLLDSVTLINSETEKALQNLLIHVKKGCLSGIPPSCTTGMNENLHKGINKLFKGHIMGPELASGLLSMFFFDWNRNRQINHGIDKSLLSVRYNTNESNELFGLGQSSKNYKSLDCKWITSENFIDKSPVASMLYLYRYFKNNDFNLDVRIFCREEFSHILIDTANLPSETDNLARLGFTCLDFARISVIDSTCLYTSLVICLDIFQTRFSHLKSIQQHFLNIKITKSLKGNYLLLSSIKSDTLTKTLDQMSRFLGISIVLITNSIDLPVIPFYTDNPVCNCTWIFVYYTGSHFVPVAVNSDNTGNERPHKKAKITCNCGKKATEKGNYSCVSNLTYKSRCPCLKNNQSCENCHCSNCKNPNGAKKAVLDQKITKIRQATQLNSRQCSSLGFLLKKNEVPSKGCWSDVETILLFYLHEKLEIDGSALVKKFNVFASYLTKKGLTASCKSEKEISAKKRHESCGKNYFEASVEVLLNP